MKAVNALAKHIMVAHTRIMAAHHEPSTVIFMGVCWTAGPLGTAIFASYVVS